MKPLLIALIVLSAAWFGLKDLAYGAFLARGEPTFPTALTYDANEHWAAMPESLPPGGWERPWGIDAFVVLPPSNIARPHGNMSAEDEALVETGLRDLLKMSEAIPGITPVYAPFYRTPSPASTGETLHLANTHAANDVMSAFERYLSAHNRKRGIILIVAAPAMPYVDNVLNRLQAEDMHNRFAGLISFGVEMPDSVSDDLQCAEILEGACYQHVPLKGSSALTALLTPRLREVPTSFEVLDAPGVATAIEVQVETVSRWLDETQPKPAEPFFDVQIIEDVPIVRPGEADPSTERPG